MFLYPQPTGSRFWISRRTFSISLFAIVRLNDSRIKAEISEHISKKPGSIINREKKVFVATKMGSLELQVVQIEGKSPIKMEDFINGYPSFIGSILDS